MSEKIKVDKAVLTKNINDLEALASRTDFIDQISLLKKALSQSQGKTKANFTQINDQLEVIQKSFDILVDTTLHFFKNTHATFVEVDEGLADRIRNGKAG